jgi:hypothetical protein
MDEACAAVRPLLSGLVDGELDEPAMHRLEAHLASCAACARALEALRAGDRLVRSAAFIEDTDAAREERALATTLARLREEPRAEWEREVSGAAAFTRRETRWRWPSWTLRARWVTGLAAAAAAVLLVLRLGPYPMSPERPRPAPAERSTDAAATTEESRAIPPAAPAEPVLGADDRAQRPAEGSAPAKKAAQRIEPLSEPATPPPAEPVPGLASQVEKSEPPAMEMKDQVAAGKADQPVEGMAEALVPQGAPPKEEDAEALRANRLTRTPAAPEAGAETGSRVGRAERAPSDATRSRPSRQDREVAPAPDRTRAKEEETARTGAKRRDTSPSKERRSPADRLRVPGGLDPMTNFRVQNGYSAPLEEASFPAVADTADAGVENWRGRLAGAARDLEKEARSGLPAGTVAERWRTLGDLWEWLGRAENDPSACARAVDAYERAREIAGSDAGIDPVRLERARRGAAVSSPGRE